MKFELYDHNRTAYISALRMMDAVGKAAIIHPTGTGKSFIGFALAAEHPKKRVLWLSPSKYIFETQLENLKAASKGDEVLQDVAPDDWTGENIEFLTYAKLMLMEPDEIAALHPAYIILDEFHCCGAQMWGQGVQRLLEAYPDAPILGLSATNIRYLDNQRDMAEELFDGHIASEITLGDAIVRGILNPPKYVLSIFKYQDDLEKYEKRIRTARSKAVRDEGEKYLEALRRALQNADGLDVIFDKHMANRTGKYIVFCANKEHMDEMMEHMEWFAKVDKHPHVYSLYAADPSTSKEFDAFKADNDNTHLRLLYCIDALNQGIHVPDISGVILLRPTVSPIIYKQQIGRALSATKHGTAPGRITTQEHYATLKHRAAQEHNTTTQHGESQENGAAADNCPVIFDIVMNIENLYSIGAIEEEMEIATAYYRSLGESEYIVNERFKVIDEVRDCVELFSKLNDVLTASWDLMYEKAKAYYAENGNLEVPQRYVTADGYSLGSWVSTQRAVRAKSTQQAVWAKSMQMTDCAEIMQTAVGREDAQTTACKEDAQTTVCREDVQKAACKEDAQQTICKEDAQIDVCKKANQQATRTGTMQGALTQEQIEKLDAIGMVWESRDEIAWAKNYNAAKAYYDEHGALDAPGDYVTPEGMALGAWLNSVRKWRNAGAHQNYLTPARIEELDKIGMVWDRYDYYWEQMYQAAGEYYLEHRNLNVPKKYITERGLRLGEWVHRQRRLKNMRKEYAGDDISTNESCTSSLTEDRIRRLDAIGMVWTEGNEAAWNRNYEQARQYYRLNGNISVPKKYEVGGIKLGYWVDRQRSAYRAGRLSDIRKKKLEAIGIANSVKENDTWESRVRLAKTYMEENGVSYISQGVVIDGIWIGKWLAVQRKALEAGELSKEQENLLAQIPMCSRNEEAWENAYELAKEYYEEHGTLNIPRKYVCSNGYCLGNWVSYQRKQKKEGTLPEEKVRRLEEIGFIWEPRKNSGKAVCRLEKEPAKTA